MNIGDKVKVKKTYVKWTMDHLDIFEVNGRIKLNHCEEIALFASAFKNNKSIKGKITGMGYECYLVKIKYKGLEAEVYIAEHDLKGLK